jgi:hypothetical protein
MPIYEYYCADNHTIYQFYAKTLAQGATTPRCPDNPKYRLKKVVSAFAITSGGPSDAPPPAPSAGDESVDPLDDPRNEAEISAMEKEFDSMDENDPKAMARMMRKMSALSGEKMDGKLEEVVRKLEEGKDPEDLEAELGPPDEAESSGDAEGGGMGLDPDMPPMKEPKDPKERRHRFKARTTAPRRDPKLYDYD